MSDSGLRPIDQPGGSREAGSVLVSGDEPESDIERRRLAQSRVPVVPLSAGEISLELVEGALHHCSR